jgi:2-polyprenyl-3-methyl-5-hydroxy-6-metoxy-1,4-benzoquinol methylase
LNAKIRDIPPCPVCTSESTGPWISKGGYAHGRCDACGHGFLFPTPDQVDIEAYYQNLNSGLSSDASWQMNAGHKVQLWRRLLDYVERTSGRGPLLDLGCGGGQFLQFADSRGWTDAGGVEPSPRAVAIARSAVSAPIHEGAWQEVSFQPNTFAAVALLDVLEHDTDPHGLLEHSFNVLRPGGSLIITVPNIQGLSIRCFGREACVVIPPEHLSYFTAKSLRLMLLEAGFMPPRTFTCDLYLKEWLRFFTRVRKGRHFTSGTGDGRERYLKWHHRFTRGTALRGIAALNVVIAVLGCGDQLVAVARKPLGNSHHG